MNIEKELRKFLYEWVKKNFGQSEADDPSWSIEALSKDLTKKYWDIHHKRVLDNIKDDVMMTAEENGISLSEKDAYTIAFDYEYSEAYCAKDNDSIMYFIRRYKGEE